MAPHSSTLAWKIPWMEEPGRLQSMGSLRVGHDWETSLSLFHCHALEKELATHSSVHAWRIPGAGEPRGLTSMGSHRVGHDWSDLAAAAAGNLCSIRKILPGFFAHDFTEKAMAFHSSTLAWKIPWTEEPGGLQSMGSLRVGHDWATSLSLFTFMHWRRKRQPTPVFLPGESQGWGSLVGCRLWGCTESDTTEVTQQFFSF